MKQWQPINDQIKLEADEQQDPIEDEIDRLRQQKEMELKLKQYQSEIYNHNKRAEQQRQQIIKEILPKHKGLKLAYDYDGSYIVAKEKQLMAPGQKAPELYKVTQVHTVFQPQKPVQQAVIENTNLQSVKSKQSRKYVPEKLEFFQSNKHFEEFTPNQGVKLIYEDKQQEMVKQSEPQQWGDGIRMTRKQFESMRSQQENGQSLKNSIQQELNTKQLQQIEIQKQIEFQQQQEQQQKQQSQLLEIQSNRKTEIDEMKINGGNSSKRLQQRKNGSKINVVNKGLLNQLLS